MQQLVWREGWRADKQAALRPHPDQSHGEHRQGCWRSLRIQITAALSVLLISQTTTQGELASKINEYLALEDAPFRLR
jgi:hypothetical protein